MKKLSNVKGVKLLSANEQKLVNGGGHNYEDECIADGLCAGGVRCPDGRCVSDVQFCCAYHDDSINNK